VGLEQLAAFGALALACFGAIGGTVRWAHREFKEQRARTDKLEKENLALIRLYSRVQIRLDRVKLAFDLVAAELHRRDPGNKALASAEKILREAFPPDSTTPPDMQDLLRELGRVE
jgi:hypothetical protein